jgi:hypothetical protein
MFHVIARNVSRFYLPRSIKTLNIFMHEASVNRFTLLHELFLAIKWHCSPLNFQVIAWTVSWNNMKLFMREKDLWHSVHSMHIFFGRVDLMKNKAWTISHSTMNYFMGKKGCLDSASTGFCISLWFEILFHLQIMKLFGGPLCASRFFCSGGI